MEPGEWYAYLVTDELADPDEPEIGNLNECIGLALPSIGDAMNCCWQHHLRHPRQGSYEISTKFDGQPAYCDIVIEITHTGEGESEWMKPPSHFNLSGGEG